MARALGDVQLPRNMENAETHRCGGHRLSLETSARWRDKAPLVLSRVKVGAQRACSVLLESNRLPSFDRYFDRAHRAPVVILGIL